MQILAFDWVVMKFSQLASWISQFVGHVAMFSLIISIMGSAPFNAQATISLAGGNYNSPSLTVPVHFIIAMGPTPI